MENRYKRFFCGETYFGHEPPIHPTSLTRFRERNGEGSCELLLSQTIDAGLKTKTVEQRDLNQVVVDTTVVQKAIAHPTDSRLYHCSRERLVKLAKRRGIPLRQSYARKSRHALTKVGRYGHGRQANRIFQDRPSREGPAESAGHPVHPVACRDDR